MSTTHPIWVTPRHDAVAAPAEASVLSPGAVTALRIAAVVAGLGGALAGLFFAGLFSLLAVCTPEATGLCTSLDRLVPALEWVIVIAASGAPLAGGIASCRRRDWRWLAGGLAMGAAMVGLALIVASGQTSVLS